MNAAPVIAVELLLPSVMVRTDDAPGPTSDGAKAFVIVGRARTFNVEVAAAAVPALVVETVPVLLRYAPAVVDVTLTVTAHEPFAGTVAPDNARLAPPLAPVTVAPTQVVAAEADAVLTRPAGYVSVNAAPVTAVPFRVGERDGEDR